MSAERFGFPASFAQERLWFLHRLEPENASYNLGWALALRGRLDTAALRRALAALAERHEALRTAFAEGEEGPIQVIAAAGPAGGPALPRIDLSGLPAGEARTEARRLGDAELRRPFDLERGPLARFTLLRLGVGEQGDEHALLLAIHHIVADAWSLDVLLRELVELYGAFVSGRPAALPELPVQYADFAVWQRDLLSGEELAGRLAWWRERLAGCPSVLDLPTDRPRPPFQTSRGRNHPVRLPAGLAADLRRLGRAEGSTLFMALLAGYAALLGRMTGQCDVPVGSAMANRDQVELEGVIGLFANMLVLRCDLGGDPGDPTFRELLARVRQATLAAAAHGDLPFEKLVEELRPERDLSRTPLVQATFELHPALAAEDLALPGLTAAPLPLESGTAKFDLALSLAETSQGVAGLMQHNADLFEAATIARWMGHWDAMLAAAAAGPDRRLSELPLLRPWERHQVLVEWRGGVRPPRPAGCLHERFAAVAARIPERPALTFGGETWTYGELARRAGRLARRLRSLGAGPGVPVGVALERSLDMVVALLAVLEAGSAYVPLDTFYPDDRLSWLLEDSRAPLLVSRGETVRRLAGGGARRLDLDDLDDPHGLAAQPEGPEATGPRARPDDLAYVIYTSGSTGRPKGVEVTHRNVLRLLESMAETFAFGPDEVWTLFHSYAFDFSVWEIFGALLQGGRLVVVPYAVSRSPEAFHDLLRRERVTVLNQTPGAFLQLARIDAERGSPEKPGLPDLRWVFFGGETLSLAGLRRWFADYGDRRPRLVHVYGITETTVFVTAKPFSAADVAGPSSANVGVPLPDYELYLLDPALEPAPIGIPGEIYVGGPSVARGYLARPALTAERFVPHPWARLAGEPGARLYRSGDLARYLPDGDLEFLGRIDRQVKLRGFRIELGEIEESLLQHPQVARAAVLVDERGAEDRRLVAYVVPAAGADLQPSGLRAFLKERLPEHLVPAALVPLAELPLNANGKLDRRALPPPTEGQTAGETPRVLPRDELESTVAAVWREVLGVAEVGVDESFFDLGGHSLLLIRIQDRLRDLLGPGREPSMVDLFRFPTVAALAARLSGEGAEEEAREEPGGARKAASGLENAVAVIGLSGRFPGAASAEELWENLAAGVESITFFSDEELAASGVPPSLFQRPDYVRARGVLEGADLFDAPFFGLTAREAEVLDPQQRLLLEQAWAALEDAGYPPESCPARTGIYAGVSRNTYLRRVETRPDLLAAVGELPAMMANHNDFLTTRISYKLDLKGPSVNVQTACSTSLVAVHMACRGLLQGDCDLALAGGVSVKFPQRAGHLYQEGGIISSDGRCRPFDAAAAGTVAGEGVGVVVLKRLADALADGDAIRAVIRGTAINNDGAAKIGYAAPGVDGQAAVIAEAQAAAGVEPETITYVEAHGTGTPLGDPIEVAALTQAFAAGGDAFPAANACALGSVKGNFGHLDAAAGVTGLIKTVLALEHRQLPPSLHFERANPEIDFASSPFYVNTRLAEWKADGGPRRAGVSSFGIGGTNAHAVLEEAPAPEPSGPSRPWQLLVLSARTPEALEEAAAGLRQHLERHPELDGPGLADAAHTLRAGRRSFAHRRAVVCASREEALAALSGEGATGVTTGARPVAFLFPGQGTQRPGATAGLYAAEAGFRERIDRCAELLAPHLGLDLREALYQAPAAESLDRTEITQPALFAIEWSLAGLWADWGVMPEAMLGHSLGEYVAACLAGVLSLEDSLALVAERGRLMQRLPAGAMLAVPLAGAALAPHLDGEEQIALAAMNAPERSVVSGPAAAIERLERRLAAEGVTCRRLRTSHAFHSPMVEAVVEPFARRVREVELAPPRIPYLSNVTGTWIRAEEATDPAYWAAHLRRTVRFAEGLDELLAGPSRLLLEVGPGRTLGSLARRRRRAEEGGVFSPLAEESGSEQAGMLAALGGLWCAGARVDWRGFQAGERRCRVPLPTYPFERRRYWIEIQENPMSRPAADETPRQEAPSAPAVSGERRRRLLAAVSEIFARLLGARAADIPAEAGFLELGADSLALIQASRSLEESFGVRVPFRRLLEDLATPAALAGHLDAALPPDPAPAPPAVEPPAAMSSAAPVIAAPAGTAIEEIAREHLRVMNRLLDMMGSGQAATSPPQPPSPIALQPAGRGGREETEDREQSFSPLPGEGRAMGEGPGVRGQPSVYVPYQPVRTAPVEGLGEAARRHVEELIARYTARTPESKRLADADRPVLSDPRAVSGFRGLWKEMVYPIVSRTSSGSRFRDVDGNEYIDLNMGFGVHLFGHSPEFLTTAVSERLAAGVELGPRSELSAEVARGICELTGMERAAFCATGTEAIMTALRAARTVTRRSKVVLFAGSYHGAFDGTLAKAGADGAGVPMAPGVLPAMVGDLLVLEYGSPRALERIAGSAGELAAVLVEPVQSRRPDLQPVDFLRELRALTRDAGVPLIFDEIVSGFRVHPAGAGGLFGVRPDLATYGKVLGGGLPIGVIAGRAPLMDALDGGAWRFGDGSVPEAELTFFACTFAQHPLSLAAARAVLARLRAEGPALPERLNERAARFAARLDAEFRAVGAPLSMASCGSILRVLSPRGGNHAELLYFHLVEKGIYAGHGRPMFLSTAHGDEDLDRVVDAVRRSVRELSAAGLLSGGEAPAVAVPPAASPQPSRPAPRSLPLTEAQEQLWVLSRLGADAAVAYNQSLTLQLSGPLDAGALERALQDVVDRHEALRITFSAGGDRQILHPALRVSTAVADASAWTAEERAARTARWLDLAAREPFDLTAGPLLRARLLRQADADHLLVLTIHHIVSDGWSMGVVLRDLAACYGARLAGRRADLPAPTGFSRYVEQRLAGGPDRQAAERYWLAEYAEPPTPLELPADRPRPAEPTYASSWERLEIDAATWSAARAAGARRGGTALATLLAAWQVLLHRLSGQRDFAVGVPAAGQLALGAPDLVGYCVELMPLRLRLDPEEGFAACLSAAGRKLLDAQEHRAFPFGALLQRLRLPRTPGRPPLVQTTFNFDREGRFELAGVGIELLANPSGASDFEIDLNLVEKHGVLVAHCDFRAALFEPATMRRWLGHLRTLLSGIAADGDRPVAELPLLDAAEREQVLQGWNATVAERPRGEGIHRLVEAATRQDPNAFAVVQGNERLTYADLDHRAGLLARRLRRLGVRPEVPVGIFLQRSPAATVALLGVLKAGGAYLPLDAAQPTERLAWMLADAGAAVVLTTSDLAGRLAGSTAAPLLLDRIDLDGPGEPAEDGPENVPDMGEAGLAYILYTSGSTGRPKGVLVPHGALVNHAVATGRRYRLGPGDRVLQFASLAFDVAAEELFATWVAGGTVVLRTEEAVSSIPAFVSLVARERLTVLNLPSSFWHEWVDEMERGGSAEAAPPPGLRLVVIGNEPVSPERAAVWRERVGERVPLLVGYGLTEATVTSTVGEATAAAISSGGVALPIGRPLGNVRAYVLDALLEPVPPGVAGELYLAGDGLARGYLADPAATAARFLPDPFAAAPGGGRLLRTGDLARWRGGELDFAGRADRQVKVRGHRVEPGEIEAVLAAHPGLQVAAVEAREDAAGDRRLVAYVVPRPGDRVEDPSEGRKTYDLWPTIGEYGVYDELMYHSMTGDEARNQAYREAIARVVPGKVVVDVGTGRDVLWARYAVSAGARRAYAIEVMEESYREGRALVERLGLADRIHLIHGDVADPSITLPEPADVCVSEVIGTIGSSEGTVSLLGAARRLVKPDGLFVPFRCVTRIAGVELPGELWSRSALSSVPRDYARRIFDKVGREFDVRLCVRNVPPSCLLSTAGNFEDLRLDARIEPEETREIALELERAGRLDGFLLWIRLETAPGLLIDSLEGSYHWLPIFFPVFYPGIEVAPGDRLSVTCSRYLRSHAVMPDYRVRGRLTHRDGREIAFDHESPWLGETLGGNPFHRAALAGFGSGAEGRPQAAGIETSPAALRSYLAARLPEAMVPTLFISLHRLPLLPSGKVDRRALPEPEAAPEAPRELPATPTERDVAAVWREVLGAEPGAEDDFFALGGHSLKAVQVLSRLRGAYGIDLTLRDFFAAPTVRGLAARVEEALLGGAADLDALLDRLEMAGGPGHA